MNERFERYKLSLNNRDKGEQEQIAEELISIVEPPKHFLRLFTFERTYYNIGYPDHWNEWVDNKRKELDKKFILGIDFGSTEHHSTKEQTRAKTRGVGVLYNISTY